MSNTKYAAPAAGSKAVYTNTTVDFGSTDVGPIVLGIKNSGADAAYYAMNAKHEPRDRAGPQAERREDEGGADGDRLRPAAARRAHAGQSDPTVIFTQRWAPVEAKTKATKQLQADLKKYADFTGRARLRDLHRLHRLRPRDHRAEAAGQEPRPEHVLCRHPQARDRSTRPTSTASPGHQRRELRQAAAHELQVCDAVKNGKFVILKPKGGGKPFWTGKLGRQDGHGAPPPPPPRPRPPRHRTHVTENGPLPENGVGPFRADAKTLGPWLLGRPSLAAVVLDRAVRPNGVQGGSA